MFKKWLLGLFLIVSLSVITACSDSAGEEKEGQEEGEPTEQAKIPEVDLEGIPEVVADVNGEEITKEDFEPVYEGQYQQIAMQAQMSGQELDQEQLKGEVAESLVGTELLSQEADNREVTVSEGDIDDSLAELVELNDLESESELMAAFKQQGMEEEEVLSELEMQVRIDQLIAEETGDIELTEDEIQEAYDQIVAFQEQMGEDEVEVPSFEEIKPDLEEELKMEKEGEAAQALVGNLRKNADVTIYL